ncbi:DUF4271 domain-containing protein [Lutibacter sp. A80]|uniref:DUF4271 domain-containing protein n=1 Tax=Lutibacter sp. A80 TaxID=2918453 RepID=UPI001F05C456|nr:DUF4271 domain-containing protein [Lutibacter sp. A80]UMB59443.1 DUF4271 domain-containing protein [Lutibacter sp. A80]
MIEAENIISQNNDWITIIFLIIFILLAIQKSLFGSKLFYTSIFFFKKNKLASNFNKEKNIFFNLYQILFFIIQLLSISLFLYFLTDILNIETSDNEIILYLNILFGVGFYFLARFLIGIFLALIFNLEKLHKKIFYEKTNILNGLILWILPFLILSSYSTYFQPVFLKITLVIFMFLIIIRYLNLIINNKNETFNHLFYFILYLCVLEIAPLIIIIKLTI